MQHQGAIRGGGRVCQGPGDVRLPPTSLTNKQAYRAVSLREKQTDTSQGAMATATQREHGRARHYRLSNETIA